MFARKKSIGGGLVAVAGAIVLPLLGAWVSGRDLRALAAFPPPLNIPTNFPRFSWIAACAVVGLLAVVLVPWVGRGSAKERTAPHLRGETDLSSEPREWRRGWWAVAWTLVWWWLSWTRYPWFAWGQHFTFFPLWLGFIFSVDSLGRRRGDLPLWRRSPRAWSFLFLTSAFFWWLFEWLNRFVANWHYLGVENFGALGYALNASLCFSTVLPAVGVVHERLRGRGRLQERLAAGPKVGWLTSSVTPVIFLACGAAGLLFTGMWPSFFYPMLWTGPLFLASGFAMRRHEEGFWAQLAEGDWRDAGSWALAGLICGFFWELWNEYSLAKWIYTVPYVDRWHVFEMPLLGFAGYLPFGLECGLIARWLLSPRARARTRSA